MDESQSSNVAKIYNYICYISLENIKCFLGKYPGTQQMYLQLSETGEKILQQIGPIGVRAPAQRIFF